jgi:hypothetical protein
MNRWLFLLLSEGLLHEGPQGRLRQVECEALPLAVVSPQPASAVAAPANSAGTLRGQPPGRALRVLHRRRPLGPIAPSGPRQTARSQPARHGPRAGGTDAHTSPGPPRRRLSSARRLVAVSGSLGSPRTRAPPRSGSGHAGRAGRTAPTVAAPAGLIRGSVDRIPNRPCPD